MYVVIKIRVEDGRVQTVYTHREKCDGEVVDASTDAAATGVAVAAEMAVYPMIRR